LATPTETQKAERPANAIGALRLLFASLVIVAHSPEMLDGDSRREPLHILFGGMSSGALAVDAFFLISGYLIAASFASSASAGAYFVKRILRIFPAFAVCSLLCVLIVAPLAGANLGSLHPAAWARILYRLLTLKAPAVDGVFVGLHAPGLNGSAWSISYEFRCYILAALFGMAGLYRRPWSYGSLTAAALLVNIILSWPGAPPVATPSWFEGVLGDPQQDMRLISAFMVGTCFWLFRNTLPLRGTYAALAAPPLIILMFIPAFAESALILLGGYILFWTAFRARWKPLLQINAKNDISYGVYLYAWPIGALLIWYWRDIPLPLLTALTFAGAMACGAASWFLIEKPALQWKPHERLRAHRSLREGGAAAGATPEPARRRA
jgi:peptidoglycan/LPS O-acetylase OafA/YrhL